MHDYININRYIEVYVCCKGSLYKLEAMDSIYFAKC